MAKTTNQRLDKLEQSVKEIKARDEDLVDITDIYEYLSEMYGEVYTGPRVYITSEEYEQQEQKAIRAMESYKRYDEQSSQNNLEPTEPIDKKE